MDNKQKHNDENQINKQHAGSQQHNESGSKKNKDDKDHQKNSKK